MLIPESQFKGSANSAWIVQIDPVWASDKWDGNNAKSVDTFKSLKAANNFKDLRTLMDDTSVYGADCGFTNPNDTPQPIPSDGKATFSRALVHHGPCGIWLDDKMVLYEDDCFAKYGNENQESWFGKIDLMSWSRTSSRSFRWTTRLAATVDASRCVSTGWLSRVLTRRPCGSHTRTASLSRGQAVEVVARRRRKRKARRIPVMSRKLRPVVAHTARPVTLLTRAHRPRPRRSLRPRRPSATVANAATKPYRALPVLREDIGSVASLAR